MATFDKKVQDKIQQSTGLVTRKVDGATAKVEETVGPLIKRTLDGVAGALDETVGAASRKVEGVAGTVQEKALFIQQKTLGASHTLSNTLSTVQSGISQLTTSAIQVQAGTQVGGVTASAYAGVMFNPATCFNLGKAIGELFKLIKSIQELLELLDQFGVPGIGGVIADVAKLGKLKIPCVDLSAAAAASASIPGAAGGGGVAWDLTPDVPPPKGP